MLPLHSLPPILLRRAFFKPCLLDRLVKQLTWLIMILPVQDLCHQKTKPIVRANSVCMNVWYDRHAVSVETGFNGMLFMNRQLVSQLVLTSEDVQSACTATRPARARHQHSADLAANDSDSPRDGFKQIHPPSQLSSSVNQRLL